jgi:Glycosyl transferase family 2
VRPRKIVRRALGRQRQPGARREVRVEPNPDRPDPVKDFRFFAVLGTWMEEDVVEATVRNAFAQGVERVYLVDNDSTDATVERAVAAGAVLAERFHTAVYEERIRILFMNAVVARESLASGEAHVWWLWIDADEFPEGPDGMTIREYLDTVDRRFRIVGARYVNHFPTAEPANLPGFHPIDLQPLCDDFWPAFPRYCVQPHWKHPLQRFDRSGPFLGADIGFHVANLLTYAPVYEPEGGIVAHHFQYRDEAATRARMQLLCGGSSRNAYNHSVGNKSIQRRFRTLDAVYEQRWADVDNLGGRVGEGVEPLPWPDPSSVRRWYSADELEAAHSQWRQQHDVSSTR